MALVSMTFSNILHKFKRDHDWMSNNLKIDENTGTRTVTVAYTRGWADRPSYINRLLTQILWIQIRDFKKVFSSILQVSGVTDCQRQLLISAMSIYGRRPVLTNDYSFTDVQIFADEHRPTVWRQSVNTRQTTGHATTYALTQTTRLTPVR